MTVQAKTRITVNERGLRIGQDHPKAKLTDIEVEAMLRDRGPDGAPTMSLGQLAKKYGLSKSGVKHIIDGDRRAQAPTVVLRPPSMRAADKRVRVDLRVSLRARSILHRLGGGRFLETLARRVDERLRRAPHEDESIVMARVIADLGGAE